MLRVSLKVRRMKYWILTRLARNGLQKAQNPQLFAQSLMMAKIIF